MYEHSKLKVYQGDTLDLKDTENFLPFGLVLSLKSSFPESLKAEQNIIQH